jgi:hypothetical protein
MITIEDYVGVHKDSPDWTPERQANAKELLASVACILLVMQTDGVVPRVNPATGNNISGSTFGGFRPQDCSIGAPQSNHKQGKAVDLYDPDEMLDQWCLRHLQDLVKCGIWIESPGKTLHWCHMQNVPPKSGNRVFLP